MWFYFYPHFIYHLTRWFPKNNRIKFRLIVVLLSIAIILPELIVLTRPKTSRGCDQPLLNILVASTVFIFFSAGHLGALKLQEKQREQEGRRVKLKELKKKHGFAFVFSLMDPVPRLAKILFHVYGVGAFILGIISAVYSFQATACSQSTPELYYWCFISSILGLIAAGYFLLTTPFWLINHFRPNSVLNWRRRSGICYEPVTCCSCVWHIQ